MALGRDGGNFEIRLRLRTVNSAAPPLSGAAHVASYSPTSAVSSGSSTPGSVFALGHELCQLARENAVAQVRWLLPQPDLLRLPAGHEVPLFLAAYPYQRHGTPCTELTWISPTPQGAAASAQFFALAPVPEQDPRIPLRIGMTGEARALIGRRTLLELALELMRALRERQFR